jgi:hypothetical protein
MDSTVRLSPQDARSAPWAKGLATRESAALDAIPDPEFIAPEVGPRARVASVPGRIMEPSSGNQHTERLEAALDCLLWSLAPLIEDALTVVSESKDVGTTGYADDRAGQRVTISRQCPRRLRVRRRAMPGFHRGVLHQQARRYGGRVGGGVAGPLSASVRRTIAAADNAEAMGIPALKEPFAVEIQRISVSSTATR